MWCFNNAHPVRDLDSDLEAASTHAGKRGGRSQATSRESNLTVVFLMVLTLCVI